MATSRSFGTIRALQSVLKTIVTATLAVRHARLRLCAVRLARF